MRRMCRGTPRPSRCSTAPSHLMHEPSDSSLLWDAVRVMVRLLRAADTLAGGFVEIAWRDHHRAAKKRARAIKFTRGRPNRVEHYRALIKIARATLAYLDQAAPLLWQVPDPLAVTESPEARDDRPEPILQGPADGFGHGHFQQRLRKLASHSR